VTALNKMCHSQELSLSWAGVLVQTAHLPKISTQIDANLKVTEAFVSSLGEPIEGEGQTRVWTNVPAYQVANFVEALTYPPESARAGGGELAAFIQKQSEKAQPELTHWTVALISNSQAHERRVIGGHDIGLNVRTPESQTASTFSLIKANILSPTDEATDFRAKSFSQEWMDDIQSKVELANDQEWLEAQTGRIAWDVAMDLTRRWQATEPPKVGGKEAKHPHGRVVRVLRSRRSGLLLIYALAPPESVRAVEGRCEEKTGLNSHGSPVIGLALSFPTSDTAVGVEYRVNRVWDRVVAEDSRYED
jgi:hypothetical protein